LQFDKLIAQTKSNSKKKNMKQTKKITLILLLVLTYAHSNAQINNLKTEIENLIKDKKADIGISIIVPHNKDFIQINGDEFYPMLSTFKFPIALTILHKMQTGELSMNQKVFIKKEELLENTWSPFKEKYPEGNIDITLEECLKWMMSYSDNNLTDILLRLAGGVGAVQNFINSKNFIVKNNEEDMHKDWESQFINKTTPNFYTQLLKKFYEEKILNKKNTKWLYQSMLNSQTGVKRLIGKLPNVKIAQRAGTSFTNDDGITGAINNVGIIALPNNRKIYISVFVHNTFEEFSKGEEIIADIAKATYDYYLKRK
jgi:beta-lactamase class A